VIDLMLAHVPQNKVEGAYNRAAYMVRRQELAQIWAGMLTAGLSPPAALLHCCLCNANAQMVRERRSQSRPVVRNCVWRRGEPFAVLCLGFGSPGPHRRM
jgi:hypothetical protein